MSWQNTWGTVKSTNAKAYALYHEVSNVGKMVEASKKRVTWRLKVEDGKEYEITLTHSIASGKKVLRVDGIVKYTAKAMSFGDWDYVFNLPGGHVVHIIIKPSVDLNDMYDLIIDNVSFRRLPDRMDNGTSRPKSYSTPSYTYQGYTGDRYKPSTSREGSFSNDSWECPHCTLVNEKPLAPVCEACGNPRPSSLTVSRSNRHSMDTRERPPPAPMNRSQSVQSSSNRSAPQVPPTTDFFGSDPFGKENSTMDQSVAFDPFGPASTSTFRPPSLPTQDSMSMLSGLDFTAPATEIPVSPSSYQDYTQPLPVAPVEEPTERTDGGDLWGSKMVDLNLNPKPLKPKTTSVKAQQTLEQARATSSTKEKTPVMPVMPIGPTPQYYTPQATLAAPAGFYQGNTGFGGQAMVPYGMNMGIGSNMGSNMGMGMSGPNVFMTAGPSYCQPSKPAPFHSNDPFATLS